ATDPETTSPTLKPAEPGEISLTEKARLEELKVAAKTAVKTELLHADKPTGASVEITGDHVVITPGTRGIEGALLDMQQAKPAEYESIHKRLLENYGSKVPGGNEEAKLVHRFVLAQKENFDPDKLNSISCGKIDFQAGDG